MPPDAIAAFFAAYREAFNRLDGEAVAALWHADGSGIADSRDGAGRLTWWPDATPMRANHQALCALYAKAGYGRADFSIAHCVPMGPDHAFALLHWQITRADGSLLQRFATGYQLIRSAQGWRVLLATAFEEDFKEMQNHAAQ